MITVFVGTAIFVFLIDRIYTIIEMIEKVAINANVNTVYLKTILKIIGIAYIIEFASGIAKDAGQGSIASRIRVGRENFNPVDGRTDFNRIDRYDY